MSYWLPDIDIAIAGDPRLFLDRMEEIGRTSGCFLVERCHDALGTVGLDTLNFRQRTDEVHRALGFQLLTHPGQSGRVAVEVRAQRWSTDPPTYDVYSEAARGLVRPLLTAFNRNHATRYRLRIERPGTGRFVISSRSHTLLDCFAVLANISSLHPRDWGRFYTLVREGRQQIPEAELRCGPDRQREAEEALARYLAAKHEPDFSDSDPRRVAVADCLIYYLDELREDHRGPEATHVMWLAEFFGEMTCHQVNAASCKSYVKARTTGEVGRQPVAVSTAKRELDTLGAALNYTHRAGRLDRPIPVLKPRLRDPRGAMAVRGRSPAPASWRFGL